MAEAQVQRTALEGRLERGRGSLPDEGARERLLAGMPVTERRLHLAGIDRRAGGRRRPAGRAAARPHGERNPLDGDHPGARGNPSVIVPDLPGHGASEVTDEGRSIPLASWSGWAG